MKHYPTFNATKCLHHPSTKSTLKYQKIFVVMDLICLLCNTESLSITGNNKKSYDISLLLACQGKVISHYLEWTNRSKTWNICL